MAGRLGYIIRCETWFPDSECNTSFEAITSSSSTPPLKPVTVAAVSPYDLGRQLILQIRDHEIRAYYDDRLPPELPSLIIERGSFVRHYPLSEKEGEELNKGLLEALKTKC